VRTGLPPLRLVVGGLLLAVQLIWFVYAQFQPWRYFAWAPNDYYVEHTVEVTLKGTRLDADAVCARYRKEFCGSNSPDPDRIELIDEGPPQHLIDQIRQYEKTYGRDDDARVVFRYRLNGHAEKEWRWP
jgi:hypothetical protein